MLIPGLVTLRQALPGWPGIFETPDFFDDVALADMNAVLGEDAFSVDALLVISRKINLPLPLLPNISLALGDDSGVIDLTVSLRLSNNLKVRLSDIPLRLEFTGGLLTPMVKQGKQWVEDLDNEGQPKTPALVFSGVTLEADTDGNFDILNNPTADLPPVQIGKSGLVVEMKGLRPCLTDQATLPDGIPAGSRGFAIESIEVHLPDSIQSDIAPDEIIAEGLFIGSGGFTGKLSAEWTGGKPIHLAGMECTLKSLLFDFKQNSLVESKLECELTLPFFDQPVNLDVSVSGDGSLLASLSAVQPPGVTYDNGLISFEKKNIFKARLEGISFEVKDGVSKLKVSGELKPIFQPKNAQTVGDKFDWPTFEIRELSIDSKGHVKFDGGFKDLDKPRTFDLKGFKLDITKMDLGHTDDGGKYLSLSGKVNLVKNAPAGASVEGLRITWYSDNREPALTLRGVGVEFTIPNQLHFKGAVSYEQKGDDHRFAGELELELPVVNGLKIMGKAVFGSTLNADGKRYKYFAIYLDGEFGTGVPLWATGLSMYSIAGLFAINYAPNKPPQMLWYSIDKSKSWFHQPEKGVVDIINKWTPEDKTLALGVGTTIGTTADQGLAFNGKFLLLLLTPGPVLMLVGSARILDKRSQKKGIDEGKFQALIVLDLRAGYFLIGLDASWKADKDSGKLVEIAGSAEAFFSFQDPDDWHLHLGRRPMDQRISANLAQTFRANAYFMLDSRKLALGVWVGRNNNYKWGPVKADLEAWLAADAEVSFRPTQFHASLQFHGYLAVRVYKFKLGLGLDALLQADVFKPFHILGVLQIVIETPVKDFNFKLRLEWGPRQEFPRPDQLPVVDRGLMHPKTSVQWPDLGATQLVPCDSRPYITFAYPVNDAVGIALNPSPNPGDIVIGDPSTGQGSARLRLTLESVTLKRDGAVYAKKSVNDNVNPELLYGVWAPSSTSIGTQNKLMLLARNPLDFGKDAGSWNPWLAGNLENYPCLPPVKEEKVCFNFEPIASGEHVLSGWTTTVEPTFTVEWPDGYPRPVVSVSPLPATPDRGLLIPGAPIRPCIAYASNFNENTVSVIDVPTRKRITTIGVGRKPWGLAVHPDGSRVYVANREDSTVMLIETFHNTVVGPAIPVGALPAYLAIHPNGDIAYVASFNTRELSIIDLLTNKVRGTIFVEPNPLGVTFHPNGQKAYVVHGGNKKLSVISVADARVVNTLDLGEDCARVTVSPDGTRAYIPAGKGKLLLVLDTETETLSTPIPLGRVSWDVHLSPDGKRAYVSHSDDGTVSTIDLATKTIKATAYVGQGPFGVQVSPDGMTLLAAYTGDKTVAFLDSATSQVLDTPITPGAGGSIVVMLDPPMRVTDTMIAWVITGETDTANTLVAVDLLTGSVIGSPIQLPQRVRGIQLSPDKLLAYVICDTQDQVVVVDLEKRQIKNSVLPAVKAPSTAALSPDGKLLYVGSGTEAKLSIIKTDTLEVTTLQVPGPCAKIIFSRDGTTVFVSHWNERVITRILVATGKVERTNLLSDGPFGLTIDPTGRLLYVSYPKRNIVRMVNAVALTEVSNGPLTVGGFGKDVVLTRSGNRLCVGNFSDGSISIIDTKSWKVIATVTDTPSPGGLQVTENDRHLVFVSYSAGNVSTIDLATNTLIRISPRVGTFGRDLALQSVSDIEREQPGGSREVIVVVPEGSLEVEVFYQSSSPVTGWILNPSGQMPPAGVVGQSGFLRLTAQTFGLKKGIDRVRLKAVGDWILISVCVKRPAISGGLKEIERFNEAKDQTIKVWAAPQAVFDPEREYRIELDVKQRLEGMGELSGWVEEETKTFTIPFKTALPPGLGKPALPGNNDLEADHQATGLNDLQPYVAYTIPVTQPPVGQLPKVTKPVYRSYFVGVQYTDDYIDQMYIKAGRSLDMLLFDGSNQPVRDAQGNLAGGDNLWGKPPIVTLTDNEASWIEITDTALCMDVKIDPKVVSDNKPLFSTQAQVLGPDARYEARLIPRLLWQSEPNGPGWGNQQGFLIWNLSEALGWKDYQVRALVKPDAGQSNSIVFRWNSGRYFELLLDAAGKRWQLKRVPASTEELPSGKIELDSSKFYRLEIEVIGSHVRVTLEGKILCDIETLSSDPSEGTVGFRWSNATSLADFGVRDLNRAAPVAYRFGFTTSPYTDFYHHMHSFQDEIGLIIADDPAVVATYTGKAVIPAKAVGEAEARAYEEFSQELLGSAAHQEPPQVEISQVEDSHKNVVGWLFRGPQPIDWSRTDLKVFSSRNRPANRQGPQDVKITGVSTGSTENLPSESVSLLLREAMNITGYQIQTRYYPGPLNETHGLARLGGFAFPQFPDGPIDPKLLKVFDLNPTGQPSNWRVERGALIPDGDRSVAIFGDGKWADCLITLVCEASQGGAAGIVFRFNDQANFYSCTRDAVSGQVELAAVVNGAKTVLWQNQTTPASSTKLIVSAVGPKLSVWLDGELVREAVDTSHPRGEAGFYSDDNPSVRFNLIEVRRPPLEVYCYALSDFSSDEALTGWQMNQSADWIIKQGLLLHLASSEPFPVALSPAAPVSDSIARCTLMLDNGNWAGLTIRYEDNQNFFRLILSDTGRRLERVNSGVTDVVWSDDNGVPNQIPVELTLSAIGSTIKAYQNGALVCAVEGAAPVNGRAGLCADSSTNASFWQFALYPVEVQSAPFLQDKFHPPMSGRWSNLTGQQIGQAGGHLLLTDASLPEEYRLTLQQSSGATGILGAVWGYRDRNNFYCLILDRQRDDRALFRKQDGNLTRLWEDKAEIETDHEYCLTIDVTREELTAHLDGKELCRLSEQNVKGQVGFYSMDEPAEVIREITSDEIDWLPYAVLGERQPFPAGTQLVVEMQRQTQPTTLPGFVQRRSSQILPIGSLLRLPYVKGDLRIISPKDEVRHHKHFGFLPQDNPIASFRVLRKADGSAFFLVAQPEDSDARALSLLWTYRLDNRSQEPKSIVFRKLGDLSYTEEEVMLEFQIVLE